MAEIGVGKVEAVQIHGSKVGTAQIQVGKIMIIAAPGQAKPRPAKIGPG